MRLVDRPDQSLMMPEAFTFSSALIFPLFIASIGLLMLVYLLVVRAQETGKIKYALGACGGAAVLTNFHTYDAIPLNITLLLWAVYSIWQQRQSEQKTKLAWLAPLLAILGTLPPLLYQVLVFRNSIEFQVKAQTPTLPPPLIEILSSYAPLVIFAIPGVFVACRHPRARLMLLWAVVTLTVIYAPVSFARKMIEGMHLPLCFLAATGIVVFASRIRPRLPRIAAVAVCGLICCFSTMYFMLWIFQNMADNNAARLKVLMPPLYLTKGDAGALRFLAQPEQRSNGAVLCMNLVGNYLPAAPGKFVYVGHWAETLHFWDDKTKTGKIGEVQNFYLRRMPAAEALQWMHDNHIDYVIDGFYEKGMFVPENQPTMPQLLGWKPIYSENGTQVYRVPPERKTS
jgi:hypothetical protein